MKNAFDYRTAAGSIVVVLVVLLACFVLGADNREARVTQIVHDVRVLPSHATARPASINEPVRQGTGVRTGGDSRAELTFNDLSLTRLGANTVFSFDQGARDLNLTSGAVLICMPPEAGTVRISTPAVTAAVSGGIAMAETHKNSWTKHIIIEGKGVLTLKSSGETLTLHAGQIIVLPPGARHFTKVQNIDLKKLTDKSVLVRFAKLPQWTWALINAEIDRQQSSPPSGGFVDPTGFDKIDQKNATFVPTPPPLKTPPPDRSPPGSLSKP